MRIIRSEWLRAFLIGASVFVWVCGLRVLDVTRVRWLLVGDTAQSYLAWEFFRKTPLLQWPLGNNPEFGKGFASSIVFTDSIPLLALILKPITKLTTNDFQYFGWWLLGCFILQVFFAFKVMTLMRVSQVMQIIAAPLFALQPALLDRMTFDSYGHMALSAHWLILAAIWLFLRPRTTHLAWAVLLVISIGVTFYFFVIAFGILLMWSAQRVSTNANKKKMLMHDTLKLGFVLATCFAFVAALGGLQSGGLQDTGLGMYRATLTSLIDSSSMTGQTWSTLLSPLDLPGKFGDHEGFGYLGIGSLLLVLVAVVIGLLKHPRLFHQSYWLAALGVLFFILALSPKVAIANRELYAYPIPGFIEDALSIVRATGRFIWLPMYLITFAAIALLASSLERKRHAALAIILILVTLQIADTWRAINETRERFTQSQFFFITDSQLWDDLARGRQHLVSIPPLSNDSRWIDLALLAHRFDMSTTASYVSRKDEIAFQQVLLDSQTALERRDFKPDTLYVVTNYPPNPEAPKLFSEQRAGLLPGIRVVQQEELTVIVRD
ncbi:MAG: hypothetical protein EBZ61_09870 [Micrococcales bacterium]|nr:hypothetical protein [Micrococcales bacterium]